MRDLGDPDLLFVLENGSDFEQQETSFGAFDGQLTDQFVKQLGVNFAADLTNAFVLGLSLGQTEKNEINISHSHHNHHDNISIMLGVRIQRNRVNGSYASRWRF